VLALLADDGWHDHMTGGGVWWLWVPLMLVVFAVLAFVVVLSVRAVHLPAGPSDRDEGRAARAIAMERYARGEITAEEYDALVHRLR